MRLTLGFSTCPNDTFLFDALVHGRVRDPELDFDVVLDDVEALNERALAGHLDLTKLSYAALPAVLDRYALLRAGSALGRGVGPLLVAAEALRPETWASLRVAIPGVYTTANFLLGWAFPEIVQKKPMHFSAIEAAVLHGEVDAGLLIHENRFTYAARGLQKLADLGEVWESRSGLPIPLGGIVARRSLGSPLIRRIDALLRASVEHAFAHPDDSRAYVQLHAQEMEPAVQQAHINLYVNSYTIDLGADGEAAVRELLRMNGAANQALFA
ncbi:MAG: 1,4-dihydroxy-6-naphthoate synthase [Bacteroidetes bacterium]|nr:1,4-dihydroxy-6-naphthoate synthase [Bacteroidota bacterium]